MAVYTYLSPSDQEQIRAAYGFYAIESLKEIAEGVENTNYLLTYRKDKDTAQIAIMTIFEKRVEPESLPFFLTLKQHLRSQGIHCPTPYHTINGQLTCKVQEKQAAIVSFLEGKSIEPPQLSHIKQAGSTLASIHMATQSFAMTRQNRMSLEGWQELVMKIHAKSEQLDDPDLLTLLDNELSFQRQHWPDHLPKGIIHADMFPNNVFFDKDGTLSGVIDFYFACHDIFAYDLAIVANAWCATEDGTLHPEYYNALVDAYHATRPLSHEERDAMPLLLRAAALRFLLTRTHDLLYHNDEALVTPHDPYEYVRILTHHIDIFNS